MTERVRVEVDPDICMGMGYCARTAPSVFRLDADGVVALVGDDPVGPVDVAAGEEGVAGQAFGLCPSSAIILTKEPKA